MSLYLFTNWAVGLINGYKQKDNGLPNNIKYGTISVTTFSAILKVLVNLDSPLFLKATSGQKMAGLFISVPIIMATMATNFCVGHHMGKAIRWTEDDPRSDNGVRIQLF
jgi:hypothetical protein